MNAGRYRYRALAPSGAVVKGVLDVASDHDARDELARAGMLAVDVEFAGNASEHHATITPADLAVGLRILADLLDAGLSAARALQCVADVAPPSWRPLSATLSSAVREGRSVSSAFRDAPVAMPPLVVGMTLAGEATGQLGASIRQAAEVIESLAARRAATRAALIYPAVLAAAGCGAVAVMVGVVIPRFAVILADLGEQLPPTTVFVMNAAQFATHAFLPACGLSIVAAVLGRAWISSSTGRAAWHGMLLKLPVVGGVRHASASARAALTLGSALESGVPIRNALFLAGTASGDAAIEERLRQTVTGVESGQRLASALDASGALTTLSTRLARAGEESGNLVGMLRHAAQLEQGRSDRAVNATIRILEPGLIVAFAAVVALIAAALLQAVYAVRPGP